MTDSHPEAEGCSVMEAPESPIHFDETGRAGSRLPMSIPILLKGTDADGKTFIEKTNTIVINRAGAKILSMHSLILGARLEVAVPHLKQGSWGTVAWLGDKKGEKQELAIALDQTHDFWGVQFPDDIRHSQVDLGASHGNVKVSTSEASVPPDAKLPQEASAALKPASPVSGAPMKVRVGSSDKLSSALRELASTAIEEILCEALQQAKGRAEESLRQMETERAVRIEDHLRRAVETALEQLKTRAADVITRHQEAWEQSFQARVHTAEEQLSARLSENEARLADYAKGVRQELARTLADFSHSLGRD